MVIIRLKALKRANKEQQLGKIRDLVQMFHVDRNYTNYQYQPVGASSSTLDPKIQKTKELFEMFHLA